MFAMVNTAIAVATVNHNARAYARFPIDIGIIPCSTSQRKIPSCGRKTPIFDMSILGKFSDRQAAERRISRSNIFVTTVSQNRPFQKPNPSLVQRPAHQSDPPKCTGMRVSKSDKDISAAQSTQYNPHHPRDFSGTFNPVLPPVFYPVLAPDWTSGGPAGFLVLSTAEGIGCIHHNVHTTRAKFAAGRRENRAN